MHAHGLSRGCLRVLTSCEHTVQSALQGYTRPHANHTRDSHMGTKLRAWTLMRRKHFQHGSDSFQWFSQKILLVYKSQYVQFKSRGSASLRLEPGQRDRGVWASPIHAPRPAQCPGGAGHRGSGRLREGALCGNLWPGGVPWSQVPCACGLWVT